MPIATYQFCAEHRTVEPYPACVPSSMVGRIRNQQVADVEAAAVAFNPKTGERVYCFANPTDPLPEQYAKEGFVKQQFKTARELEKFCRDNNLVNDMEYGNRHDGAFEEHLKRRSKDEKRAAEERAEKRREYQQARERAMKEMGLKR